jgi:hypothetical protein
LIETVVGKPLQVTDTLRYGQGVQAVDSVTGPYGVIAVVEAAEMSTVARLWKSDLPPLTYTGCRLYRRYYRVAILCESLAGGQIISRHHRCRYQDDGLGVEI